MPRVYRPTSSHQAPREQIRPSEHRRQGRIRPDPDTIGSGPGQQPRQYLPDAATPAIPQASVLWVLAPGNVPEQWRLGHQQLHGKSCGSRHEKVTIYVSANVCTMYPGRHPCKSGSPRMASLDAQRHLQLVGRLSQFRQLPAH